MPGVTEVPVPGIDKTESILARLRNRVEEARERERQLADETDTLTLNAERTTEDAKTARLELAEAMAVGRAADVVNPMKGRERDATLIADGTAALLVRRREEHAAARRAVAGAREELERSEMYARSLRVDIEQADHQRRQCEAGIAALVAQVEDFKRSLARTGQRREALAAELRNLVGPDEVEESP